MTMTTSASPTRAASRTETDPRRPLHIAIVDEELPYPLTSGKRIRTFNLISRLADRHRLTYLCHRNPNEEEQARAESAFAELGIETVVVNRAVPPKSGLWFYARLARNLLSPLPYSVTSHESPELRAAIADHVARHPVDLWHCEWTPYAHSLREQTGIPKVVVAQNVESMIWQRYRDNEENPWKRWYIHQQWRKFDRFERRTVQEVACTVAVSGADAAHFYDKMDARHVEVVDNGVDTDFFRPGRSPREPGRILFLGSLDWRPNLDGVRQLLDHIFPRVRAESPQATLCLVGRNPPESLRERVAREDRVELHADVPDVRPFLDGSSMMVVPLRIGGGSRLKILESLAAEVPVVSTPIGAEGLHLEEGRDLTVAESNEGLSEALLSLMADPDKARTQAVSGRGKVLARYDWSILSERLEEVWYQTAMIGA